MPTPKKRFFKHKSKTIGDNSGKPREKKAKKADLSVRLPKPIKGRGEKNNYSPNIYRSIAERFMFFQGRPDGSTKQSTHAFFLRKGLIIGASIIFACLIIVEIFFLFFAGQRLASVLIKRQELLQNMRLWEGIAQKYPTYRDAYFHAAVFAYELGDDQKKNLYLQKVLLLDPNYEPAKRLQSL